MMAAASLALVAGAAWFASAARQSGWTVQSLEGAPQVAGAPIDAPSRLPVGQLVTTDAASRARIDVGSIGVVDVEPNSRLRLVTSRAGEHRMALDRGGIRALIWAPPGLFFVNTPAATAVDLGCAYRLQVDDRGWGKVHVETGWVAFEYKGRESFIPKDAMCATRPGFGPGTPCYEDAPAEIRRGPYDSRLLADAGRKPEIRARGTLAGRPPERCPHPLASFVAGDGRGADAGLRPVGIARASSRLGHTAERRARRPAGARRLVECAGPRQRLMVAHLEEEMVIVVFIGAQCPV